MRGIVLVLLTTAVLGVANAASLRCEDLFLAKPATSWQKIRSLPENWAALVSRRKPTYQSSAFDLRILSTDLSKNTFSPAKLRRQTIQEVRGLQSSYRDMGFSFRSFIQVLVEAHTGALGKMVEDEYGEVISIDFPENMPLVGDARALIGVPGLFGRRELFIGRTDRMEFEEIPRFLYLPAVTSTYHSIESRFAISHELAHLTENPKGHRDRMWREARADFLAFLTTGHTDLVLPDGIEFELMRADGSSYKQVVTTVRSMTQPTVASVSELWPSLYAFHFNSQILSSALYKVAQTIGRNRALEFVKWMDRLGEADAIPFLSPKPTKPKSDFQPMANTEYIDQNDQNAVRVATADHLNRVGQLFRRWVREADLAPNERSSLNAILTERGI